MGKGKRSLTARSHQPAHHNTVHWFWGIGQRNIEHNHALAIFAQNIPDGLASLAARDQLRSKQGRGGVKFPEIEDAMLCRFQTGNQRHPGWRRYSWNRRNEVGLHAL